MAVDMSILQGFTVTDPASMVFATPTVDQHVAGGYAVSAGNPEFGSRLGAGAAVTPSERSV